MILRVFISLYMLLYSLQYVNTQGTPNQPGYNPLYPREDIIFRRSSGQYGVNVKGFTMKFGEKQYVSMFLGIPYASPPTEALRFAPPEKFQFSELAPWDSTYFHPACPQLSEYIREDIPKFSNISENCLYLNIFSPNRTYAPFLGRKYPVMVYFHGGGFINGTAQQHPGFAMAQRDVVLVTVNYRLGALGFLTTEDVTAPGNFGMLDQVAALEFVRDNINVFDGDADNITIFGHESGAASVGLHLISPKTRTRGNLQLFQRAILMSGSDMCEWAVIDPYWRPRYYAYDLAQAVGCPTHPHREMLDCMRYKVAWGRLTEEAYKIKRRPGSSAGPWAPVVDGSGGYLPSMPAKLRENKENIQPVQVLGGVVKDDGSQAVEQLNLGVDLDTGLPEDKYEEAIRKFVDERLVFNDESVAQAVKFEYTYWPQPDNSSARTTMLIDMLADYLYGTGLDQTLKSQVELNETYMYEFHFRSLLTRQEWWKGVAHKSELQYVFGFPYLNSTSLNTTGVVMKEKYSEKDKNISDYMMITFTAFAAVGNPTPTWFIYSDDFLDDKERLRNNSWFPYNRRNLTYMEVSRDNSTSFINYRQDHYAFWQWQFSNIAIRYPDFTTYPPTPPNLLQYQTATWTLVGFGIILIILILILSIYLYRRWNKEVY